MARGRMISKSLSTSSKYAALANHAGKLAEFCQALYPLLVSHADDFGRLAGDVFTVKFAVVPTSPRKESDVQAAIVALHASGLIEWYETEDGKCIQIHDFDRHQSGLHRRTESRFPGSSGNFPELPSEEKGTKQKGTKGKGVVPTGFQSFWDAYPTKVGKAKALESWNRISPDDELVATILSGIERSKPSQRWREGIIPNPSTWLNQGRWDDELPVGVPSNKPMSRVERAMAEDLDA
jgi:hypothetical protein